MADRDDAERDLEELRRQEIAEWKRLAQRKGYAVQFGDPRLPGKFWSKAAKAGDCWVWQGHVLPNGYGTVWLGGAKRYVHRVTFAAFVSDRIDGLDVDHLCRERACCNPAHLEAVTRAENLRRGIGSATTKLRYAAMKSCRRGHPYMAGNTAVVEAHGYLGRKCLVCAREMEARRKGRAE